MREWTTRLSIARAGQTVFFALAARRANSSYAGRFSLRTTWTTHLWPQRWLCGHLAIAFGSTDISTTQNELALPPTRPARRDHHENPFLLIVHVEATAAAILASEPMRAWLSGSNQTSPLAVVSQDTADFGNWSVSVRDVIEGFAQIVYGGHYQRPFGQQAPLFNITRISAPRLAHFGAPASGLHRPPSKRGQGRQRATIIHWAEAAS